MKCEDEVLKVGFFGNEFQLSIVFEIIMQIEPGNYENQN